MLHGLAKELPSDLAAELMLLRYMERLHLPYAVAIQEPWSIIERAHYVWSLDSKRAKLEAERQKHNAA